ncbi:hypothetical protein SVI_3201 [Shewanella violacea DSS12]|uniref:Uncharacterized protein n=1 Tax=Shewanella violacea (strain JCM 10179 / CIP 106290 / LMG 19151 / DSS12) TaxID=637905 RepID=D4ZAX7_SHEVD|nr:hypothetical protein SVI_3201 [Shewanella violacea DSS12]
MKTITHRDSGGKLSKIDEFSSWQKANDFMV